MSAGVDVGIGQLDFEREEDAVASLTRELQDIISDVAIVVEEEPPPGQPLLALYQAIPLTGRGSGATRSPFDARATTISGSHASIYLSG